MIAKELASAISRYVENGKNQTLHRLAKDTKVPYINIRRIMQNEVKTVSLETFVSIMQVIATWEEMLPLLEKYYPNTGNWLLARQKMKNSNALASSEVVGAISDYQGYVITILAGTPEGTTEAKIVEKLGISAKTRVNELLDSGVLKVKSGRLFMSQEAFTYLDLNSAVQRVEFCLRLIAKENIGQKKQLVSILTDGVSVEGQQKIHDLLEKTQVQIDSICKEYPGSETVFTNLIMGAV